MSDPDIGTQEEHRLLTQFGWPWPLAKACVDYFHYALGLRDGTVIYFTKATASDDGLWVTLAPENLQLTPAWPTTIRAVIGSYNFERGLVVRVADIVWCADAPFGS